MKGLLYYYFKNTQKSLTIGISIALVYNIYMAICISMDMMIIGFEGVLVFCGALMTSFFVVTAPIATATLKDTSDTKTLLSAPVSQSKLLLAKYIYVFIVTMCLVVLTIGFEFMYSFVIEINAFDVIKTLSIILGIRLIVSSIEVPLFHLFNPRSVNALLLIAFLLLACGAVISLMFVDLKFIYNLYLTIKKFFTNKNFAIIINIIGIALTFVSYGLFSKVKREID